jgi:hypothetical protein
VYVLLASRCNSFLVALTAFLSKAEKPAEIAILVPMASMEGSSFLAGVDQLAVKGNLCGRVVLNRCHSEQCTGVGEVALIK